GDPKPAPIGDVDGLGQEDLRVGAFRDAALFPQPTSAQGVRALHRSRLSVGLRTFVGLGLLGSGSFDGVQKVPADIWNGSCPFSGYGLSPLAGTGGTAFPEL